MYFEGSVGIVWTLVVPVTTDSFRVSVMYVTAYESEVSVLYVPVAVYIFMR